MLYIKYILDQNQMKMVEDFLTVTIINGFNDITFYVCQNLEQEIH